MIDRVYKLALESLREGGSPGGMSKWARRAACGRKALQWELTNRYDGSHDAFGDDRTGRLDHLMVGTIYHVLHEFAHSIPDDVLWDAREVAFTPELQEGLRLYHTYVKQFYSVAKRWQLQDIEFEVGLVAEPSLFGGQLVTGRMDAYGYIGPQDAQKLFLPGAGHYVVDFKTASAAKDLYTDTPQAKAYMALAQLQFPDHKVRGMIFDQVVKADKPEFHHYVATPTAEDLPFIQALVAQGARNIAAPNGRCNTKEERKLFGGCRCPAVAPAPLPFDPLADWDHQKQLKKGLG